MSTVTADLEQERALVPGPSGEGFAIGLYLEHLEEASFLYEQRLVLLDDPEVAWPDLEEFEERIEAHLDALMLGEALALAVCRRQAAEGDAGELHAALCIFCRQDRPDIALQAIEATDPGDEERVRAIAGALGREMPPSWQRTLTDKLCEGHPVVLRAAARAFGCRRVSAGRELLSVLPGQEGAVVGDLVWALGRLCEAQARSILYKPHLQEGPPEARAAAALALLRIGDASVVQYSAGMLRSEDWAALMLGLGGSRSHLNGLLEAAASDAVTPDTLLALGLMGDPAAVDLLLYSLERPDLAESAALALNLITGADLYVETFVPEPVEEDELFPDEQPADGGAPLSGTTITVLDTRPGAWRTWCEGERAHFQPGIRYRNGTPYRPSGLVENLRSTRLPRRIRQLAYEEMVIRYGCDVLFETDLFVIHQRQALSKLDAWVQANTPAFKEGKWYIAGKLYSW